VQVFGLKKPSAVQLVLGGLGIVSAFLPWLVINTGFFTTFLTLADYMTGRYSSEIATYFLLFGGLFLAGSLALLIWRKAYILQLIGMSTLTVSVVYALASGPLNQCEFVDQISLLLGMTGIGIILAWISVLCGLILFGPARLRAPFERLPYIGPAVTKYASELSPKPGYEVSVPIRARSAAISFPEDHRAALASAERYMAAGDLPAALRSFGRALGASKNDQETAVSKVKIAVVLDLMGRELEAARFMQEAEDLYPAASYIFQNELMPLRVNGQAKQFFSGKSGRLSPEP
jgi:tetratricopeptide (TPR) repeat protein